MTSKYKVTPEIVNQVEALAAQGLNRIEIATSLGISYETLRVKAKHYSAFSAAIDNGKAKGIAVVTNALFKKCEGGDVTAMKYYLNNRSEDWSETRDVNVSVTEHSTMQETRDRIAEVVGEGSEQAPSEPITH